MAMQQTKFIDVTRSFVPMDPNAFPDGMHVVDIKEEQRVPVMAYAGHNFLPTAYGYRSFFGTEDVLAVDPLEERVDHILLFQNELKNNILIALCDSGIWYKSGSVSGAWTQAIVLDDHRDTPTVHYPWSYTILDDELFCYRANNPTYYRIGSLAVAPGVTIATVAPTFLNMAAQIGIFRAGNRLGFWDSDDSIGWSSLDDFQEFTPDLETLAGNSKFPLLIGKIVTVRSHGDGFIIYATKSIVYVANKSESLFLWDPTRIMQGTGIAYPEEIIEAMPDIVHFAYTSIGLYKIENATAELIIPEITDFFKLSGRPKYLKLIEGRYLCFEIIDANYASGFPQVTDVTIPALSFTITAETYAEFVAQTQGPGATVTMAQFFEALQLGYFMERPEEDGGGVIPLRK